jgi:hypothetical protein
MRSLRVCLIAAAVVLEGLAAGCQRKPIQMKNMTLESRPQDPRSLAGSTYLNKKYEGMHEPGNGPAPPPLQQPGQAAH